MILEEFQQPNSILLNLFLDLRHQVLKFILSFEISLATNILWLRVTLNELIANFRRISILQEIHVDNLIVSIRVLCNEGLALIVSDDEAESG